MVNFQLLAALVRLERDTPKPGTPEAHQAINFLIGTLRGNMRAYTVHRVAEILSRLVNGETVR